MSPPEPSCHVLSNPEHLSLQPWLPSTISCTSTWVSLRQLRLSLSKWNSPSHSPTTSFSLWMPLWQKRISSLLHIVGDILESASSQDLLPLQPATSTSCQSVCHPSYIPIHFLPTLPLTSQGTTIISHLGDCSHHPSCPSSPPTHLKSIFNISSQSRFLKIQT